jgi:hypothetical protein
MNYARFQKSSRTAAVNETDIAHDTLIRGALK